MSAIVDVAAAETVARTESPQASERSLFEFAGS